MNFKAICTAIGRWNKHKSNASKIQKYLNQGHMFEVSLMERASEQTHEFLHVYPGIHKGRLCLFALGAGRDREEQSNSVEGILPYIMPCTPDKKNLPEHFDPIPKGEGVKRIYEWADHCHSWLEHEVKKEHGIHECFVIPTRHLKVNHTYQAFFALKGGIVPGVYHADLVIFDPAIKQFVLEQESREGFFDTVRLVPPFSPDVKSDDLPELNKNRYFLLNLSASVVQEV